MLISSIVHGHACHGVMLATWYELFQTPPCFRDRLQFRLSKVPPGAIRSGRLDWPERDRCSPPNGGAEPSKWNALAVSLLEIAS